MQSAPVVANSIDEPMADVLSETLHKLVINNQSIKGFAEDKRKNFLTKLLQKMKSSFSCSSPVVIQRPVPMVTHLLSFAS